MRNDLHSISRYRYLLVVLSAVVFLSTCRHTSISIPISQEVTPFTGANSAYDDFNSGSGPILDGHFPFYFSSNRATLGGTFDIVSMYVYGYHRVTNPANPLGEFVMDVSPAPADMVWPGTNSPANEYGPTRVLLPDARTIYFYASDVTGTLDIYFVVEPGEAA
jgi:hypothetical protein